MQNKVILSLMIGLLSSLLLACGQSGKLYLPNQPNPNQPVMPNDK